VAKEIVGVEMGSSTVSRFIKKRGIPFIGGKGGPKGNGATGRGRGRPGRRLKPVSMKKGVSGIERGTVCSSPYAPLIPDQNTSHLSRTCSQPGQDPTAHGPYS
jgi:hypothetical protein